MNTTIMPFDPQTGEVVQRFEPVYFSPSCGSIALALSKAQKDVKGATKDAANPFFKSRYADLESVWNACREALSANELAVMQMPYNDGINVGIVTILAHSSGEWMQSRISAPPSKNDAQSIGSVITYLRRYALAAMVGVAPTDDDGEAAVGRTPQRASQPTQVPKKEQTAAGEKVDQARVAYERIRQAIHAAATTQRLDELLDDPDMKSIKEVTEEGYNRLKYGIDSKRAELKKFDEETKELVP